MDGNVRCGSGALCVIETTLIPVLNSLILLASMSNRNHIFRILCTCHSTNTQHFAPVYCNR